MSRSRDSLPEDQFLVCPSNENEWKILDRRIITGGIYDSANKFTSTSTFGIRQYLGLKVIWKNESSSGFLQTDRLLQLGTDLTRIGQIRQAMHSDPTWRIYLANLDGDSRRRRMVTPLRPDLGAFAIVLQNQRVVSGLREGPDHELKVAGFRGQGLRSASSDPGARRSSSSNAAASANLHSPLAGLGPSVSLFDSPLLRKLEDAETACEEVVKMAALSFLQGIFINDLARAYWSAQPKTFTFGQTKMEASVDGHLHMCGTMKSVALLNVSARKRPLQEQKNFRTEWLESAQMALWIKQEPDSYWTSGPNRNICRRVMVSQNHSDMFVILGEYETSYLDYLNNRIPLRDAGFLTMRRFGPFSTDKANDVDLLACVLKMLIPLATFFSGGSSTLTSILTTITAAHPIPCPPTAPNPSASGSSSVGAPKDGPGSRSYSPDGRLDVLRSPFQGLEWTGEYGSPSKLQETPSPSPPSRSMQNLGLPELFAIKESNHPATSKLRAESRSGSDSSQYQRKSSTPSTAPPSSDKDKRMPTPTAPRDVPTDSHPQSLDKGIQRNGQRENNLNTSGFSEGTSMDQAWAALEFGEPPPDQPATDESQQAGSSLIKLPTSREEAGQERSSKGVSLLTRGGLVSPRRLKELAKPGSRSSSPLRTAKSAPAATSPRASNSQSPRKLRAKTASR